MNQQKHMLEHHMRDLEMHEMTINILEQSTQKHAWITHTTRTNNHDNDIDNDTNQQSWTINTKTSIVKQINLNNDTALGLMTQKQEENDLDDMHAKDRKWPR